MKLVAALFVVAVSSLLTVRPVSSIHLRSQKAAEPAGSDVSEPPSGGSAVLAATRAVKDAALVHLSALKMEKAQTDGEFAEKLAISQKSFDAKKKANDRVMDCIQANKNLKENTDKRLDALKAKQVELEKALEDAKKAMKMKASAKQTFKRELQVWNERLHGDSEGRLRDLLENNKNVMEKLAKLPESVTGSLATVETVFLETAGSKLPDGYQNPDESALDLSSNVVGHEALVPQDKESEEDYMAKLLNRANEHDVEANSFDFVLASLSGLLRKYKNAKNFLPKGTPKVEASAAFSDIMQTLTRLKFSVTEQMDKQGKIERDLKTCSEQAAVTGPQLKLVQEAHEKLLGHKAESEDFYAKKIEEIKEEIKFASDSIIWMSKKLEDEDDK